MIMPHSKECEHGMEMVQQAWGEEVCSTCGKDGLGEDAIILYCTFPPEGYNVLHINK